MATTITNLHPNPSVETNLTNIIASAVSVTMTRELHTPMNDNAGDYAVKAVTDGTANLQGVHYRIPAGMGLTGENRPFVASVSAEGAGTVYIWKQIVYTDATTVNSAANSFILTGSPIRYTTSVVRVDPAKTVDFIQLMVRTNGAQAVTFWTDAALILEGEENVDYFDGDSPNAAWTGTAHASTSVLTILDSRIFPVLKIGSPHIGPLRVGRS